MRLIPLALAAALLSPFPLMADLTLVQEILSEGSTTKLTMQIKGSKVRVDSNPMATSFIDTETGDMTNLIHPQKMIMRISGAQLKDMAAAVQATAPAQSAPAAEPKATGRKEKINGHDTEEYTVGTAGGTIHLWIAKNYPDWKEIVAELARMSQGAWAKQLGGATGSDYDIAKLPGLPLRTEMQQPGGSKTVIRFESIDRKPVEDAAFAVPAGYTEMKMPAMGIPAASEP
jgi:hypothetical protein